MGFGLLTRGVKKGAACLSKGQYEQGISRGGREIFTAMSTRKEERKGDHRKGASKKSSSSSKLGKSLIEKQKGGGKLNRVAAECKIVF